MGCDIVAACLWSYSHYYAAQPTQNVSGTETAIANRIFATITAGAEDTAQVQPSITQTEIQSPAPSPTVVTHRVPTIRPPTVPQTTLTPTSPPTAKVTFPIFPDGSLSPTGQSAYPCYQDGGFYEVVVYVKKVGTLGQRSFVPFLTFGAFAPGGSILTGPSSASTFLAATDDGKKGTFYDLLYNINCAKETPANDTYNGKLDVTELVQAGNKQIAIRFVRSSEDPTPNSPEVVVDFSRAGRWWLYYGVQ